jgi:hypothetical protein
VRVRLPNFDPSNLGSTIDGLKSSLGGTLQALLVELRSLLGNGLTIKDHMFASVVVLGRLPGTSSAILTSGVEYLVANPLPRKSKPIGFYAIHATDENGTPTALETSCVLDVSRADGRLAITCNFETATAGTVTGVVVGG